MKLILVNLLLFASGCLFAQMDTFRNTSHPIGVDITRICFTDPRFTNKASLVRIISGDEYAKKLSFFCRQEIKWEKNKMPLKVRVGSFNDCNYLERKSLFR